MILMKHPMKTIFTFAIAMALLPTVGYSDQDYDDAPSITKRLPNATQGPLWPPSELVDKDGNFVVVGTGLIETAPGVVAPMPNQALLVSKNTVPPLNSAGKEDFSNPIGAPYKVIRPLNLSPGSADLKKELYTVSFGPFSGDFGGGQRIPAASDSLYNLNMARPSCLEVFPTESQKFTFTRPSFPLSKAPVNGFQGDQIAYDIDTGKPYDPMTTSGPGCGDGCPGENNADQRSTSPITLGDWLKADGKVKITLTQYNGHLKAYTAARFDLDFKKLRPNSVYTVWAVRKNAMLPRPDERLPTPLGVPNTFTSDNNGNGHLTVNLKNPFPDPATDDKGLRIMVLAVVYHSDYQNWGACPAHFGPGVDVHQAFNSSADGTMDITNFMTKEAP